MLKLKPLCMFVVLVVPHVVSVIWVVPLDVDVFRCSNKALHTISM